MIRKPLGLTPDQEIAILKFWADGVDLLRVFSPEEIDAIPGLAAAIEAVRILPSSIGWGDEDPQRGPDRPGPSNGSADA